MITKLFLRLLFLPVEILCCFIPQEKDIWVFGSWSGRNYNDNTKHLFNYILNNKKNIRPIWLTKNRKVYELLRSQEKECYYFYSVKGIYYSLTSSVACVSDSWVDLPLTAFIPHRKRLIVQLWHGTLLRKVDFSVGSLSRKIVRYMFLSYLGRGYDLVTSGSYKNIEIFKNLFNVSDQKIKVLGQPRNDTVLRNNKTIWASSITDSSLVPLDKQAFHNETLNYISKSKDGSKTDFIISLLLLLGTIKYENVDYYKKIYLKTDKIFLYMPTWRDNDFNLLGRNIKFDLKKLSKFLEDNKSVFLIKHHYYDYHKYKKLPRDVRVIFINEIEDIYPMLSWADVLLTDYSSIYFDFLLLNRPIIFAPFDLKLYASQKGFYYDYNAVTPGPKGRNWNEVIECMNNLLKGEDKYKTERGKLNNTFNHYKDSKSSQRVFDEIKKQIHNVRNEN